MPHHRKTVVPFLTAITLAILTTTTLALQQQPPTPDKTNHPRANQPQHKKHPKHFTTPIQNPTDTITDTDVLHYTLDIEIDLANKWIGGSNLILVQVIQSPISTFQLRISDAFATPVITVNYTPVTSTRLNKQTIEITLDRTYNPGEQFNLYIEYQGNPYSAGFGSIEFTTHNGSPIAWTLSESIYAYTWWPNKDVNTDKSTADLYFTVPNDISVASQGTLISTDDLGNGKHTFHWQTTYPTATYLYSFAATNYNQFSETFNYNNQSMPLNFFIFPENDTTNNRNLLRKTVDMLGIFSDLYGLYPFINEKYGIAQFGWGGGMEHQTITSQSSFAEWLSAHELAHQWWGDMITCATWHDIWLNEGFASYSEALWEEFKNGQNSQALHNYMENLRPSSVNGSVYVYDISNLNRIFSSNFSYRKPAWVLHSFRHIVGDTVFFNTLTTYRSTYEYGSAITDDFINIAQNTFGSDLTWFFNPWIYDIGAPQYKYAWNQSTIANHTYIELYLKQTQSQTYPVFPMPIDIATGVGSPDTTNIIWNDQRAEHLLFEVNTPIDTLQFDPDTWILDTGVNTTTFVQGPPKIVNINPQTNAKGNTTRINITFHKQVSALPTDFSLVGTQTGPVPFTMTYNTQNNTAILTPDKPLPTDTYLLDIHDSIIDINSGQSLDGELDAFRWNNQSNFPSGDGLPGGDAIAQFQAVYHTPGNNSTNQKVTPIAVYPWP